MNRRKGNKLPKIMKRYCKGVEIRRRKRKFGNDGLWIWKLLCFFWVGSALVVDNSL
jgi:hypothetical protein